MSGMLQSWKFWFPWVRLTQWLYLQSWMWSYESLEGCSCSDERIEAEWSLLSLRKYSYRCWSLSSSDSDLEITKLWHMWLGHISERGMDELTKQHLLCAKKTGKLDFCEHCVFGKQCRVKFRTTIHRTKVTLDYIHSNIWVPSRVPSLGGGLYILTFIDDYSRKV